MKAIGRFRLELEIQYGDGSGGTQKSCHDDPEGVVLAFLIGLQDPNPEYAMSGSWFESYIIYDLEKDIEYTNIHQYIDAMHNEKDPNDDWSHMLTGGLISLGNREIYHASIKKALAQADVYKALYLNSQSKDFKQDIFKYRCWKCGKPLTDANRSPIVYMSDPPKYACIACDHDSIPNLPGEISIKKEEKPVLRPFKNCDELISSFYKDRCAVPHLKDDPPIIWIVNKENGSRSLISNFGAGGINIFGGNYYSMQELFDKYTFPDGSPIGVED